MVAFEVLEHIKFKDVDAALKEMRSSSNRYVIFSVLQLRLYIGLGIKIPRVSFKSCMISAPLPLTHTLNGEYYWELGTMGHSNMQFKSRASPHFHLLNEFWHPADPYHKFFIFEKANNG